MVAFERSALRQHDWEKSLPDIGLMNQSIASMAADIRAMGITDDSEDAQADAEELARHFVIEVLTHEALGGGDKGQQKKGQKPAAALKR